MSEIVNFTTGIFLPVSACYLCLVVRRPYCSNFAIRFCWSFVAGWSVGMWYGWDMSF